MFASTQNLGLSKNHTNFGHDKMADNQIEAMPYKKTDPGQSQQLWVVIQKNSAL